MIKIDKPNIRMQFCNCQSCLPYPTYYKIDNGYYIKSLNCKHFTNKNGDLHRLDGYARIYNRNHYYDFYINGIYFSEYCFAGKTNHLICNLCQNFCKQECFIR